MAQTTTVPFWKGTNFYLAALMFIGSFFGLQENTAQQVVMAVVGIIAAGGGVRQFLQTAKFGGFLETLKQPNTLNYLIGVLTLVGIPQAGEIVPALKDVVDALVTGNWGLVITRGIALLTILFYIFKKKPSAA